MRIALVVAEVSRERRVSVDDIKGGCRVRHIKEARWEVWRRLIGPNDSISSVARKWPCDHATINHALNVLEARAVAEAAQHRMKEAA